MALNLKQRFTVGFSLLFSVLLGALLIIIFILFARFRHEDFQSRLEDQLVTDLRLFVDINKADSSLVDMVERDAISHLVNEGIYIFDEQYTLLYKIDNDFPSAIWQREDLVKLEQTSRIAKRAGKYDLFGMKYISGGHTYLGFVEAEDVEGNTKLSYLKYVLFGSYLVGVFSVWVLSFYLSKSSLRPFDILRLKIQDYSDPNLKTRLTVSKRKDEIDGVATAFNLMMDRIDLAYSKQKEFTGNASHELRTPLSRITGRITNLRESHQMGPELDEELKEINEEVYQMADMVSSLLLFSKITNDSQLKSFPIIRVDELMFNCMNEKSESNPDVKFNFDISSTDESGGNYEINGDESLLRIAVLNIIKNAYLYSDKKEISILLKREGGDIVVECTNSGKNPIMKDLNDLFLTFSRADNSAGISGTGIGLSIVKRVMDYHKGSVTFTIPEKGLNRITLKFKAHS
jgi:two-component system sensor histidine kinase ArlS